MIRCDCRRPAPEHGSYIANQDAMRCLGCSGWITAVMMMENRWGLTLDEFQQLFGIGQMESTGSGW